MSIENIIGKILAEAHDQSSQVREEADGKSCTIIEKAKVQAEKTRRDLAEQAKAEAQLLKSRRISVAELEARKMRLGAKQALISRCFAEALDQLAAMAEPDYLDFLVATILAAATDGGELLLNTRDREAIGEKLVKKVNSTGKAGTLTLAKDTIDAKGGFILRQGSMEINSTLETMVSGICEVVTPDVVKVLFG
ncbi:MAG: V-type ATP synthase subunit E family protein [Saccharofermentanales bacterium]